MSNESKAPKSTGVFSPAAEQPLNHWLMEMARARSEDKKVSFADALAGIKRENPRIAEAARIEATGGKAEASPKFLQLMRRALEIAKSRGLGIETAMEHAAVENPALAQQARRERGGSLYLAELQPIPGVGDASVLMSEGVDAALDPSSHLVMLANERCRERSISFAQALSEIGSEHPALAHASREQATRTKIY